MTPQRRAGRGDKRTSKARPAVPAARWYRRPQGSPGWRLWARASSTNSARRASMRRSCTRKNWTSVTTVAATKKPTINNAGAARSRGRDVHQGVVERGAAAHVRQLLAGDRVRVPAARAHLGPPDGQAHHHPRPRVVGDPGPGQERAAVVEGADHLTIGDAAGRRVLRMDGEAGAALPAHEDGLGRERGVQEMMGGR